MQKHIIALANGEDDKAEELLHRMSRLSKDKPASQKEIDYVAYYADIEILAQKELNLQVNNCTALRMYKAIEHLESMANRNK